jgi:Ca2+-binding RTX toxin-like protein
VVTRPTGDVMINDTSVDSIMDFDRDEGDIIDVSALGVRAISQLSFNDGSDTVTVIGTGEQFRIIGASDIQASDFFFAT